LFEDAYISKVRAAVLRQVLTDKQKDRQTQTDRQTGRRRVKHNLVGLGECNELSFYVECGPLKIATISISTWPAGLKLIRLVLCDVSKQQTVTTVGPDMAVLFLKRTAVLNDRPDQVEK